MKLHKKINILASLLLTVSVFSQAIPAHAAFPGQNGNIAYTDLVVTDNGNGGTDLTVSLKDISSTGTNNRAIGGSGKFFSPRYSADGTKLTATGPLDPDGNGLPNIYVMNADGSSPVNVTNINQADFPDRQNYVAAISSFHPSGTKLAYSTIWEEDDGNGGTIKVNRINTINTDGSNQQELTSPPEGTCDAYPVFSPDGSKIAFMRGEDDTTTAGIYTMNTDGSNVQQLVTLSTAAYNCAAAEDIFYTGLTPSALGIGGVQPSSLDWSPDSTHIVYMEGSVVENGGVAIFSNSIYVTDLSGNRSLVTEISSSIDNSLLQNPPETQPPEIQADGMMGVQYTPDGRLIYKTVQYNTGYTYPDGGTQWEEDSATATMTSSVAMIKTDGSDLRTVLQGETIVGQLAQYQLYAHMLPSVQPVISLPALLANTGTNIWFITTFALSMLALVMTMLVLKRQYIS